MLTKIFQIPVLKKQCSKLELIKLYKTQDQDIYELNFLLSVIPILEIGIHKIR